jgi:hypothetical protein
MIREEDIGDEERIGARIGKGLNGNRKWAMRILCMSCIDVRVGLI